MKAVLISIKPQWCEKIINGEKTIEVRKTRPKLETPFKGYLYKTKETHGKLKDVINDLYDYGKVIGEFVCDKCIKITSEDYDESGYYGFLTKTCLSINELFNYGKGEPLYGLHISDLKIYDKPKELGEFNVPCKKGFEEATEKCIGCQYAFKGITSGEIYCDCVLTRPPKSWCYVEELEQ